MKPIGIIIPTRWEAAPVLRAFQFKRVSKNLYRSEFQGRSLKLCLSGVGMERAGQAADALCRSGAGLLVSAGFCGALSPDLTVGLLVTARIATSRVPIKTPLERSALSRRASAIAVDMETQAIVESGTRYGIPIRVVRIVSDTVHDDLSVLLGDNPGFSAWRIAKRLVHPRAWPLAYRLWQQSAIARGRLVQELSEFFSNHAYGA